MNSISGTQPAIEAEPILAAAVVGADGMAVQVVGTDVRCVRCGYELRGLPVTGMCPECGGEVRRSLLGDLLVFADAGYVRTLRIGASLALAGIIVALFTIFGGVGLLMVAMIAGNGPPWFILTMLGMGGLSFGVLSLVGWWLLSTPDPGRLGTDTGVTARKLVRVGVLMTVGGWMLSALMGVGVSGLLGAPLMAPMSGLRLIYLAIAIGWIGVVLQLLGAAAYMGHMAGRVRSGEIVKSAKDVRTLTIATASAGAITTGMAYVLGPIALIPAIAAYGCFALTAGRYASVVAVARREIKLAEAALRAEVRSEKEEATRADGVVRL